MTFSSVLFHYRLRQLDKDYQLVYSIWGADYNDPMTFLDMFVTGGFFNTGDWSNAEYDGLVKAAQMESDAAIRANKLEEAEKVLMENAGVDPLYFRSSAFTVRPAVENLLLPPYAVDFKLKWMEFN